MRIAFFGTPEFAVPTLDAVAGEHELVLVVAQPDRPSGRGMQLHAPPVAVRARELGATLLQPAKIREQAFLDAVAERRPEIGVVVAYGRILPPSLLAIPPLGMINVHASLLPRYRGAAPIQRAIEAGDEATGVTIMRIDEQLDHGPMLARSVVEIGRDEHAPSLSRRLAESGARAILPVLRALASGDAVETEQDHSLATLAPKIDKSEGLVRWSDPARRIYDRYRAFDPWPGLFTEAGVKLGDLSVEKGSGTPGGILDLDDGVLVAAGEEAIRIRTLQRPGKARGAAGDVARGLGWKAGMVL